MSTHNIGFYEDLTKIIFELSSNIIKYAPYFFCCTNYFFSFFLEYLKFSNLVRVVVPQAGFSMTLSEIPKSCFLAIRL